MYGEFAPYEGAFKTHEEHSRRHNYPISILRYPMIEGIWNKPFFILSTILKELEKPEDERLEWLL